MARQNSGQDLHPLGFSGGKNEYRRGVREGNYAEDILAGDCKGRTGSVMDKGGAFCSETTSSAAYSSHGKSGPELAAASQRRDVELKYGKYGKSTVMPEDKTGFWASTTQLAYEGAGGAAAHGSGTNGGGSGGDGQGPTTAPSKVQDLLWGASKWDNSKVPVSSHASHVGSERQRQLDQDAAASPYRSVQKDCLEAAARDSSARQSARPPMASPHDPDGEDTQTGRKASGECASYFDKDYHSIGLRKQAKK